MTHLGRLFTLFLSLVVTTSSTASVIPPSPAQPSNYRQDLRDNITEVSLSPSSSLDAVVREIDNQVENISSEVVQPKRKREVHLDNLQMKLHLLRQQQKHIAVLLQHHLKDEHVKLDSALENLEHKVQELEQLTTQIIDDIYDDPGYVITCPARYFPLHGQCFLISHNQADWYDARHFCQYMGGDLANPRYAPVLLSYVRQHNHDGFFWLGGSDVNKEGVWLASSGQTFRISPALWANGEPNNARSTEHCLEIRFAFLNDNDCSKHSQFICEHQPESVNNN